MYNYIKRHSRKRQQKIKLEIFQENNTIKSFGPEGHELPYCTRPANFPDNGTERHHCEILDN